MEPDFKNHVEIKKNLHGTPEHTFVMFFADGCGHCHTSSPLWKETAIQIKKEGRQDVLICAIEAQDAKTVNPNVNGYPTFCYYHSGVLIPNENFNKERSVENFKKWIHDKIHKKPAKKGGKSHKKRIVKKRKSIRRKPNFFTKWLNIR